MNLSSIWEQVHALFYRWNFSTTIGNRIYAYAVGQIGTDASPNDLAPDELGCAESVSTIVQKVSPDFPIILSTAELYTTLKNDPKWVGVSVPLRGDVIISPTGMGGPKIKNGHTGIMADSYRVMSNSSATGTWQQNYNLDTWKARWFEYPIYFFRKIV